MGLEPGTHTISNSRLIHRGTEIALESLELELSVSESGEMAAFASARLKAKVSGLDPGEADVKVVLQWEGEDYQISEARIFDVDSEASGETIIQITGKLEAWSEPPG